MTTPSTANAKEAGAAVRPVVEKGAVGESATHSVVEGEVAPRLPHERDQSSDSGKGKPDELIKKAAADVARGRTDDPRGPQTQEHYSELTGKARTQAKPG